MRQHLTDAADFATLVAAAIADSEDTEAALVAQVNDLTARLEALEAKG